MFLVANKLKVQPLLGNKIDQKNSFAKPVGRNN